MHTRSIDPWALREMSGATISDRRCRPNLIEICSRLFSGTGKSWSAALGSRLRQAAYNILDSSKTNVQGLLAGHIKETALRSNGLPLVLAAQDTTEFDYSGHESKDDLGHLSYASSRGLLAHGVLAMHPCGTPLGVVGLSLWTRNREEQGQKKVHRNHRTISDKESQKWLQGLQYAEDAFDADQPLLLLQDREADIFALLAAPRRMTTNLLIRASKPRNVEVKGQSKKLKLFDAVAAAPVLGSFGVKVPRRPNQEERMANLTIQAQEMTACPPANQIKGEPCEPQKIWAIQVTENAPPENCTAINWTLISTLPVDSLEDGKLMVEYYTRRWIIERLHYTLKSGLSAEQLQIDDQHRLKNALAILYIVAWQVMSLTYMARNAPDAQASEVLTEQEVLVLRQMTKKDVTKLSNAVNELAKMGGYEPYRNGPPPGVKSVWIGLRSLQTMIDTWNAAISYKQNVTQD